ncbi:hypothetical protein RLP63_000132 [Escherichia coli]|nr:hypothetical protein [Escherichia coli]ELD8908330.1 hypothetical protein [Escherichia coli]HCU1473956.1 hypothetical protein [Escherichia coli]
MPGIVVAQNFNNTALPAGESLASALIADSGVKNWFQADVNSVTLSGNDIVSFNDRKGTASKLTRADAAKGATLVSNAFGQYSGARFNAAESDLSLFSGDVLDLTQPFSWSGVATLRALAASSNLCGTFTSSSVRAILNVSPTTNAGKLQFLYGSAKCVGPTLDLNTPFAFVCGYDGTNIFLRVNGVMASVAAAGSPSSSAFALGALPGGSQFWDGDVSDLFLCTVAMNTSAGASLLTKLTAFYEDVYGLTL